MNYYHWIHLIGIVWLKTSFAYLQDETSLFTNDFPTYVSRAFTAFQNQNTYPSICQGLPKFDASSAPKTEVVVQSSNAVITVAEVQAQCSTNTICIIEGKTLAMDSSLGVFALIVRKNGKVSWTDQTQSTPHQWLCAGYIAMEVGGTFDMTLSSSKNGWIYISNNGAVHPQLRSRVFGAVGDTSITAWSQPTVSIKGRELPRTWSLLAKPFGINNTTMQLQHNPTTMGWQVGDRIAIAPTMDRSQGDAQSFVIIDIAATTGVITLNKASNAYHEAKSITTTGPATARTTYQSAEVINLSRNIIITGDDFTEIPCDPALTEAFPGFGTSTQGCMCTSNRKTCTAGLHTVHMNGGNTQIQNVRVEKCGQRGIEGKYCLHFHQLRSCPTCLYKNNAIEFSMQRGLVVHGTHNSLAESNVFYDVRGANLYIEDGNEILNTFSNNVAICPWSLRLEGCSIPGTSNAQGDTELNQAGIYLESPSNHLLNNRMANHFNGMFLNPTGGRGPVKQKVCPDHMPLGLWEGNMYHSSGRFGTYALNGNYPVQNTGSSVTTNGETVNGCFSFTSAGTDNGLPVKLVNNEDYGNAFVGHYGAGDIQYQGHVSFGNLNNLYWKETKNFADGCAAHLTQSYFLKGNLALPDSLGSFIIERTTLEDVQLEANHHCGIGVTGFLCMPHYVLHNVLWIEKASRTKWVDWTQSNDAGSGGIFSLSPQDAAANVAGTGGTFLPRNYQSLVSSVYPYLLKTGVCDSSDTLGLGTRYQKGILCKVPLRAMKIYTNGISSGDLLVQVWRRSNINGAPVAEQTVPFYSSNDFAQGFKFPVLPGPDWFYRIARSGSSPNLPTDWIIDFGDSAISNRWGVDTLYVEISGRSCGDGSIRSDHDRRYFLSDISTTLKSPGGLGWGHGACTSHAAMPLVDCTNVVIPSISVSVPRPVPVSLPVAAPVAAPVPLPIAPVPLPIAPVPQPIAPVKLPVATPVAPVPVPVATVPVSAPVRLAVPSAPIGVAAPVATPPTAAALRLQLIYVPTNQAVMELRNGTIVYASDFASARFNIQAIPAVSSNVKSVSFSNGRRETATPFAYCGDSAGKYNACANLVASSSKIITVTATASNNQGKTTVSFQILPTRPQGAPTPAPSLRKTAPTTPSCDGYCPGAWPYGCNPTLSGIATFSCNPTGGCLYYDRQNTQPVPPDFCVFQRL